MEDNHNEDKDDRAHKDGGGGDLETGGAVVGIVAGSGGAGGLLGDLSLNNSGLGGLYNKNKR